MMRDLDAPLVETRLRILTWNVWWRYGPWQERAEPILSTVEALAPDVIALQEVWGEGEHDFARVMAERLGFEAVFESRDERAPGVRFGNAVVSRWPIAQSATRPLPAPPESEERRLVLRARIEGPRGAFDVYTTHLNWRPEHGHVRQLQVAEVARFVADAGPAPYPPIVCGDFNAEPDSDEMRMLTGLTTCPVPGLVFRDAWRVAGDGGPGHTWDDANPHARADLEQNARIDYVLVGLPREDGEGHVVECRVAGNAPVDRVWPSDHFGVYAELRY